MTKLPEKKNKGGRPKGALGTPRKKIQRLIDTHADVKGIIRALSDSAKGLKVEGKDGEVYKEKPDTAAGKFLVEQRFGTPVRSEPESGPVHGGVTVIVKGISAPRIAEDVEHEEVQPKRINGTNGHR